VSEKADEKLLSIVETISKQINYLTISKCTGKYNLTIELNMNQGGITDAFLQKETKERIK
jgi:tRNA(Phe) wybutosine-synthesizing methylase Tyw3